MARCVTLRNDAALLRCSHWHLWMHSLGEFGSDVNAGANEPDKTKLPSLRAILGFQSFLRNFRSCNNHSEKWIRDAFDLACSSSTTLPVSYGGKVCSCACSYNPRRYSPVSSSVLGKWFPGRNCVRPSGAPRPLL